MDVAFNMRMQHNTQYAKNMPNSILQIARRFVFVAACNLNRFAISKFAVLTCDLLLPCILVTARTLHETNPHLLGIICIRGECLCMKLCDVIKLASRMQLVNVTYHLIFGISRT